MIKNKFVQFVLYVVVFALEWNLLSFLWDLVFTQNVWQFSWWDSVIFPLILGAACVWLSGMMTKKKAKKQ